MIDLTIGGGNYKGICYLGVLHYLYENNLINNIQNFYGASVGSIIGVLYLIGYKPIELFTIVLDLNLADYFDFNLENLEKHYSILNNKLFNKILELFIHKENSNITFLEFYKKYNINLNILVTSLKTRTYFYCNYENSPNLDVFSIMKASCSVPLLFPPVIINNDYYVDGCMKCIDGICSDNFNSNNINIIIKSNYNFQLINSLGDYINELVSCSMQNNYKCVVDNDDFTIIVNNLPELNNIGSNFNNINKNDKLKLFHSGILQAQEKLDNNINNIKSIINN